MAEPTPAPAASDLYRYRIGYICDVEGNWDYLQKCILRSDVLYYAKDATTTDASEKWDGVNPFELRLRSECYFVFGGDVCDLGGGDIRVTRQLLALKKRYPDRVILIIGNRDINKIKLTSELEPSEIKSKSLNDLPGPYWVDAKTRVSPYAFLVKLQNQLKSKAGSSAEAQSTVPSIAALNTRANRLRYMFIETMGCPNTFELRRNEIALLSGKSVSSISDDDVVSEVLESLGPGGYHREYLLSAQLGAVIGDSLFVHGAVRVESMGFIPDPNRNRDTRQPQWFGVETKHSQSVREWIDALNRWVRSAINEWIAFPHWCDRPPNHIVSAWTTPHTPPITVQPNPPGVSGKQAPSLPLDIKRFDPIHKPFPAATPTPANGSASAPSAAAAAAKSSDDPPLSGPVNESLEERWRGGYALSGYFYMSAMSYRTCAIATCFDESGSPAQPQTKLRDYLAGTHMTASKSQSFADDGSSVVSRIVVGHKPWGDSPTVIRDLSEFEILSCDTSYSAPGEPDRRGAANAAVTIHVVTSRPLVPDPTGACAAPANSGASTPYFGWSSTSIHGVLSDATAYAFTLPPIAHGIAPAVGSAAANELKFAQSTADPFIGRRLKHSPKSTDKPAAASNGAAGAAAAAVGGWKSSDDEVYWVKARITAPGSDSKTVSPAADTKSDELSHRKSKLTASTAAPAPAAGAAPPQPNSPNANKRFKPAKPAAPTNGGGSGGSDEPTYLVSRTDGRRGVSYERVLRSGLIQSLL